MITKFLINLEDLLRQRTVEAVHADAIKILLYMQDFHGRLKLKKEGKTP